MGEFIIFFTKTESETKSNITKQDNGMLFFLNSVDILLALF